jgi:hypothetical protein
LNKNVHCFSIYPNDDSGNVTLKFISSDRKDNFITSINIKDDDGIDENIRKSYFHWLHYALIRENNSINISTNDNVIRRINLKFVPRFLVIYSNYLIFHDCKLNFYAGTINILIFLYQSILGSINSALWYSLLNINAM